MNANLGNLSILLVNLMCWVAQAQMTDGPAMALRSELTWTPTYAGDPLRVRVFLSSPRVFEESLEIVRRIEQGDVPPGDPPAPSVQLPAEWQTQVSLRLSRVKPDGTREEVLSGAAWTPYLRPQVGLPAGALPPGAVRSREWLVPAEVVQLTAGPCLLETSWNGRGLAPAEHLPASGILKADDLRFQVASPGPTLAGAGGADPRADHLGRLAFAAYVRGDHIEARRLGTEALQSDPGNLQPDRLETHLLVARSALAADDYDGAKAALDRLSRQPGADSLGEVLEMVTARLESLAPRLRLFPTLPAPGGLRLEIDALPGQRYVTYESTDLRSWSPLSTNRASGAWISIEPLPASRQGPRFFRSVLQP